MSEHILQNIAKVQGAFQEGAKIAAQVDIQEFSSRFENENTPYLSAKFEGASYQFALSNIENLENDWLWFVKNNPKHQTQIFVGLGWALAETNNLDSCSECDFISEEAKQKVADGFGFYEGTFRKRKVVSLVQNNIFPQKFFQDYYAGVGRSIWYSNLGNPNEAFQFIEKFPEQVKPYLWRGIGTAFCYVGGFSVSELEQIVSTSNSYKQQFSEGVAACYISRKKSKLLTDEVLLAAAYFSIKD